MTYWNEKSSKKMQDKEKSNFVHELWHFKPKRGEMSENPEKGNKVMNSSFEQV